MNRSCDFPTASFRLEVAVSLVKRKLVAGIVVNNLPAMKERVNMDSLLMTILLVTIASVVTGIIGYLVRHFALIRQIHRSKDDAEQIIAEAQSESQTILLAGKEESLKLRNTAETEVRDRWREIQNQERRVSRKEEQIDNRVDSLEKRDRTIAEKEKTTERIQEETQQILENQIVELERVASMQSEEARDILLERMDEEISDETNRRVRQMESQIREETQERSREILIPVIQRYAGDVVAEMTTTVVPIPNDDMKGRLIGREGRNIRALENATGVNLIVDDTPEAVTLSSFDPIRREVARLAVSKLVQDGRIQPARIEEEVEKAEKQVDETVRKAGEDAAYEAGVNGLKPEILKTMGRLRFRYSYGQNVLKHSIEVAILSAAIAADLRANVDVARRSGFLHDIGKALTHEIEGPHAMIGADLLKRVGVSQRIVHAVADHHGEAGNNSQDGFIVAAGDAISGARPGARRDTAEAYTKRLENLEEIANEFEGVDKCYAIQAGREMRIMVRPEHIDDVGAMRMARDVAKRVEETLDYPGQIRITVIRETRSTEYAK